jgi:hypothetical protein
MAVCFMAYAKFRSCNDAARSYPALLHYTHGNVRLTELAPRGAWLRQDSCQEISCSRPVNIKEVCFASCSLRRTLGGKPAKGLFISFLAKYRKIFGAAHVFFK